MGRSACLLRCLIVCFLAFLVPREARAADSVLNMGGDTTVLTGKGSLGTCGGSNSPNFAVGQLQGSGTFDGCLNGSPTLVELVSFSAEHMGDHVLITWTTAAEIDTVGFHLWRSESAGGGYARITQALIAARGGPVWDAAYEHEDTAVAPGTSYWYKLEDIDANGAGTFHGPVFADSRPVFGWAPAVPVSTLGSVSGPASTGRTGILVILLSVLVAIGFLKRTLFLKRRGAS